MDNSIVCITLCLLLGRNVTGMHGITKGQILVSHREGVIVTSSSQNGSLKQSGVYKILDNKTNTYGASCHCCSATTTELNPWYKIDLGLEYLIHRINVKGPIDFNNYLYNVEIQLGTTQSDGTVLQGVDNTHLYQFSLDHTLISPVPARFITLTLRNRRENFVICEVYVYANCIDGRHGPTCNEECGHCGNNDVCDKDNGYCPRGCSDGYKGTNCKQDCNDGRYGPYCNEECGKCYNKDTCYKTNGTCPRGCAAGYFGSTCNAVCQPGTYGFSCTHDCGMCRNEDVCDRFTGICSRGCADRYKGSQCLTSDTCFSRLPFFIGSLIVAIFVNTTSGLLLLLYRNRLHRKTQKAANSEDTSFQLQNTPSNNDTPGGESVYMDLNRRTYYSSTSA